MNHRAQAFGAFALFTCGLFITGCEAEGVGTVGPKSGAPRKDDSFLIPGFDPEAAKASKKKGKASASKPAPIPDDIKDKRH